MAPSPGVPDVAAVSVPDLSVTSMVTRFGVATVRTTWADPMGPAGVAAGAWVAAWVGAEVDEATVGSLRGS